MLRLFGLRPTGLCAREEEEETSYQPKVGPLIEDHKVEEGEHIIQPKVEEEEPTSGSPWTKSRSDR